MIPTQVVLKIDIVSINAYQRCTFQNLTVLFILFLKAILFGRYIFPSNDKVVYLNIINN